MNQVALPISALACPGCGSNAAWLKTGESCSCGWISVVARKKGRVREFYARRHAAAKEAGR